MQLYLNTGDLDVFVVTILSGELGASTVRDFRKLKIYHWTMNVLEAHTHTHLK